jgi:hypothetical protein
MNEVEKLFNRSELTLFDVLEFCFHQGYLNEKGKDLFINKLILKSKGMKNV